MDPQHKSRLRETVSELLAKAGDPVPPHDADSLFVSGRLDSLAMVTLVMHLESSFGIDFGRVGFDLDRLDSIREIEAMIDDLAVRP